MTIEQAEKIFELAKESSISKAYNYVLVESAVAELIESDNTIYVKIDQKLIELIKYDLKSIKLITVTIPCEHLNKLIKKGF